MKYYIIAVLLLITSSIFAQFGLPSDVQSTLNKMGLEYLPPVEQAPNFLPKGKVKYFDYDFGIEIDNGKTLILVQTRKDDGNYIPQVMISALVATLATNDQDVNINMISPSDIYLKETNSDWAIEAVFTPKDNIGDYEIAHLKSLFRSSYGMTNILYLAKSEVYVMPLLRYTGI